MKITRRFTKSGQDVLKSVEYELRISRITNPDGSVVFEMKDALIPRQWSQLATDIMVSKYFRKAGVPQYDQHGNPLRDEKGNIVTGPERSAAQVIHRLAGCWRHWGETHGYFDTAEDAQAFYDEIAYMLLHQMCAPNSPQWFNTGLNWAYGISGPSQGHFYVDERTGEVRQSEDAYTRPQPHACFIQSVNDDLVNPGGIMDLWTREARLYKYGSGSGTNFSRLRGENEPLSGGGKSSGLMSFLKIGDRAAGAIKSGGTTRRAAKMVCLDLDHPDIEAFINWKVREELKVAAMVEGLKHLAPEQQEVARKLGLKLDYDFNGEAYYTVSGQNSNNSVRIPHRFFKAVEADGQWELTARVARNRDGSPKVLKTVRARELWDQIAYAAWRCADPGVQFEDTINQWHTCPVSGRINASNPCVTGDTRVLCPGGIWRRIDQMIHLPARIVTNVGTQAVDATEGAFPTGVKDVFELRTMGGYRLTLTADHQVWTANRGWVEASALQPTDLLCLPSRPACTEEIGEPQDPQFFHLLGLLLSAANADTTALRLDACLGQTEAAESLAQYVGANWLPAQAAYDDDYADATMLGGVAVTAAISHRRLLSRLNGFIDRGLTGQVRLGDALLTAGLPAQRHFLRGLFTADGSIERHTLELPGAPGLLEDVQLLLLGFGIQSAVRDGMLRIDPASLRAFARHIGLLPGRKADRLATAAAFAIARAPAGPHYERLASLTPLGPRPVFDLTEPRTSSFVANGLTVHNCSEYMFLDDTACNLASLNVLTFFDPETRAFDIDSYRHAIRLWTVVLEISVLMASFPSEAIARLSYRFRTLGLGYANLGAMLMQAGIPYDSDRGRAVGAALTAILTGESYATSAEMAREHGPFPGYAENREAMLRVIRNHRRAAWDVGHNPAAGARRDGYEGLDIPPVGLDSRHFAPDAAPATPALLAAARQAWDQALTLGEQYGYRNAQVSVVAPTGCLVGRSLVTTSRGLLRLDYLGDVHGTRWQDVDFTVATDEGERPATQFFVNGAEPTRRIVTRCGYSIEGTLKHRIKVIDPATGLWEWKYFADIAPGDIVPLAMGQLVGSPRPVALPPQGELYWTADYTTRVPRTVTPELAEFVGYFMGDGSLHARGLRLCVTNTDGDVVERLANLGHGLFNLAAQVTPKEGYLEVAFHSVALALWWEAAGFGKLPPTPEHAGKGYQPRIPAAILASNDPVVYRAFARGLFEADGTVVVGLPSWSTAHPSFADEVATLLLTLGLPTSRRTTQSGWGGPIQCLRLRNASYVAEFTRAIGFMGTRKRQLLREPPAHEQAARKDYVYLPPLLVEELVPAGSSLENAVMLSQKRHAGAITRRAAQTLLEETGDARLAQALTFYYDTVEANDDAGEQLTYDISVPDNVTYFANGFVSHNTIGLLMDCDTTGVEPDFALVKFKKLAGGGYFKIANQSLPPALRNLGYTSEQISAILTYVMGTLSLDDAPHINRARLLQLGLTAEDIGKIEQALPGAFDLGMAVSPWVLGEATMARLGIPPARWQDQTFSLLRHLGFTRRQIDAANDIICGRGTVEGAPHLRPEHLPVFDCASKCGRHGRRFIHVDGHIRMMAATQPFVSGAISKTINLPHEATVKDIADAYMLSWRLGLKATALYRDGSKLSQPLNIKSDQELEDKTDAEDEDNVAAARDEVAAAVARAAATAGESASPQLQIAHRKLQIPADPQLPIADRKSQISSDNLAPSSTTPVEKIIERIVERPLRRRLPDTRKALTHKFDVQGHEGYVTVGLYDDGSPGEVFITMAKEGSTIGGLMDTIATLVSVALQYGVPVDSLVRKFEHVRFEPSGMTRNPDIPIAKSLVDYIFRWLAMEFIPGYRATNSPRREKRPAESRDAAPEAPEGHPAPGHTRPLTPAPTLPASTDDGAPPPEPRRGGNGHGPGHGRDTAPTTEPLPVQVQAKVSRHGTTARVQPVIVPDPLSLQSSALQADAPACDVCGAITVRSGTCYKCLNCGNSMGCS